MSFLALQLQKQFRMEFMSKWLSGLFSEGRPLQSMFNGAA